MKNKKSKGEKFFHEFVDPIFPKFKLKDMLQVVIGAAILAVPIGFTEETWKLGESLPMLNVLGLLTLSILFISLFTYYQYHKHATNKNHWDEFTKRTIFTYVLSFIVVSVILVLIQRAPWYTESLVAFKRVVIVTFPSSLSAVIADTLK